jgi:hypothetical protein
VRRHRRRRGRRIGGVAGEEEVGTLARLRGKWEDEEKGERGKGCRSVPMADLAWRKGETGERWRGDGWSPPLPALSS